MTPFIYLTATLIAAFASLLVVFVNVMSSRISRGEDREEKRDEWLRDKQVRDVEEIIPTLSGFLKDLSDIVQQLDSHLSLMNFLLGSHYEGRQKHAPDSEFIQTDKAEVAEFLKEDREKLKETTRALLNEASVREPWFDFHAKRLSIWFDDDGEVEQNLSSIGDEFKKYHLSVVSTSRRPDSSLFWPGQRKGELTDEDIAESKQLYGEFEKALEGQHELNTAVSTFQRELADRFKHSNSEPIPSSDGLLVKIARWLEKKVRFLLWVRLRERT